MAKEITTVEAGRRGGNARAAALSPERRRAIARKACKAKWAKYYREQKAKANAA